MDTKMYTRNLQCDKIGITMEQNDKKGTSESRISYRRVAIYAPSLVYVHIIMGY